MAFKTQVKLQQLTGTMGAGNDITPAGAVGTAGLALAAAVTTDIAGVLQIYGDAIANIHGKADFASQTAGLTEVVNGNNYDIKLDQNDTDQAIVLESAGNKASSIYLHADAGTTETIKIHADQGTSVTEGGASVPLLSDVGGVELRSTANLANAVNLTVDGGTTSTMTLFNDTGTSVTEGAASVQLLSDAGGIGIKSTANLASAILLTADGGTSETIKIHADQSTVDGATGAGAIELTSDAGGISLNAAAGKDIYMNAGQVNVVGSHDVANTIYLHADAGTTETIKIHADQGTAVSDTAASVQVTSDVGAITLASGIANAAAIRLKATNAAGGIDMDAGTGTIALDAGGISLDSAGVGANFTVASDGGAEDLIIEVTGATDSSVLVKSSGTGVDAISLATSAGGMDITVAGAAAGEDLDITCNQEIRVTSTSNAAEAIYLRANAGTSETIKIHADQGTSVTEGAASVSLLSDAGGVELRSTANLANAVNITNDGGTTGTIMVFNDQGTSVTEGAASVQLLTDAGGIGIKSTANLAGSVRVTADGGAAETIIVHADQSTVEGANDAGAIQLIADAGGVSINAAADKDIYVAGGQVLVTGEHNTANTIYLHADAGTSETIKIHADQGTSVTEGASSVQLLSDAGGVELKSTANLAKSIKLIADGGTSETIYLQSDQGTGADSIELLSDAGGITISAANTTHGVKVGTVSGAPVTIGHTTSETTVADNLTVTGDLFVNGTHTYINTKEVMVEDKSMVLGVAGGMVTPGTAKGEDPAITTNTTPEMLVIPTVIKVTCLGCPILRHQQVMFLDMGTGTTADNIYTVTNIEHVLETGAFTTSFDMTYIGSAVNSFRSELGSVYQILNDAASS